MLLTVQLEELMKRLWSSPDYIRPSSPEVLLENLIWIYGDQALKDHIFVMNVKSRCSLHSCTYF